MTKALVAVAIMLLCASPASAQLGNLGKIAKNKVTGTGEYMARKAKEKGEQKARQKMWEIVKKKVLGGSQMPELPWIMDEGVTKSYSTPVPDSEKDKNITWYVTNLDRIPEAEVRDMKAKLDARYNANKKILIAKETGVFSQLGGYTDALLSEIEKEQGRWESFYGEISQYMLVSVVRSDKMKDNGNHNWTLIWDPGQIIVNADKAVFYVAKNKSGKLQFYSFSTEQGAYASSADLEKIKKNISVVEKLGILLEGLTTEFDSRPDDKYELEKLYAKTQIWVTLVSQAMGNNTPDNVEKAAMPKAGKLNASLKAKALAIAKSDDSSVLDVVITSNNWEVKPLERRIVYGYVIRKDELGKMAVERSWCQDYMGGGKYGSLRHYGVGLKSFYVK